MRGTTGRTVGRIVQVKRNMTFSTRRCRDTRKKTTLLFLLAGAGVSLGWQSSAQAIEAARWGAVAGTMTAQVGQSGLLNRGGEPPRERADRLLLASRAALEAGNPEAAEKLLVEAEGMRVPYGVFHMGDTPKKLRRDLDRARAAAATPASPSRSAKPHSAFTPSGMRGAAAEDPFANGQAEASANAPPPEETNDEAGRISRQSVASSKKRSASRAVVSPDAAASSTDKALPHSRTASRPARQVAPSGSPGMAPPPDEDQAGSRLAMRARRAAKPTSSQPAPAAAAASSVAQASHTAPAPAAASDAPTLLAARKALAGGDLRRANTLVAAIKKQPPQNMPSGDSIEHVEALIKRQQTLRDARAAQGNQITEEIRRDLALLLVDYAQGLMVYGELDDAERLVNDAVGLGANLPAGGPQPALVLKQIAQLRTGKLAEPARLVVHEGDVAPSVAGGAAVDKPISPAKAQVLSLMARARVAIESRDFGTADMLLQQAMKISPPAKEFGPGEDRPELVLRDLQQARTNGGVRLASGTQPLPPAPLATSDQNVAHAFYDPRRDTTANARAGAESTAPEGEGMPGENTGSPFDSADNSGGPQWPAEMNQQNTATAPAGGDEFAFPEETGDTPFDAQMPGAEDLSNPAPNQRESTRRAASAQNAPATPETMSAAPTRPAPRGRSNSAAEGMRFFAMGENALQTNDPNTALAFFRQAAQHADALPDELKQRLQKHLETLEPTVGAAAPAQYQAGQAGLITPGKLSDGANNNAIGTSAPAAPASTSPVPPAELDTTGADAAPKPEEGDATSPGAQPTPASPAAPQTMPMPVPIPPAGLLGETSAAQRVAIQRLVADIGKQQLTAKGLKETDPKQALEVLDQAARLVQQSGVDTQTQSQLLARLERTREEINAYYEANRATIELKESNAATVEQVERERAHKREIEVRLAEMIDNYNKLMDEHRYEEANVVAKQACELAPNNALALQLKWNANFVDRMRKQNEINDLKERGFVDALYEVERSSVPFNDNDPFQFGDKPEWDAMTKRRKALTADRPRRSEAEMQIEQKLKTPVSLEFQEASLSEVLTYLAKLCDINIYLDPQGLAAEGVDSSQKVNVELSKAVMLKSALNIILEPLHLSYVIKDEVLKITSEQVRDGEIVPATYYVADLVIPIPNFVPGPRLGLASSLHDAYGSLGYGGGPGTGFANGPLTTTMMSKNGAPGADGSVLANVGGPSTMASPLNQSANPMLHSAPGGAGGGVVADFDSLIDLITSTIAPTTWEEVGGQGAIESYRNNLSLVISQTEDVHDQIRDLLEQLRKLQDLQVTIEVRFITLNDNFFERIGVDFDFFINRNENSPNQPFGQPDPNFSAPLTGPPITGGFSQGPLRNFTQPQTRAASTAIAGIAGSPGTSGVAPFTADLDLPFTQGSFSAATPPFGPFDANSAANFGFAILSDIEAFFLLQAAQADRRSNVLQAPKVTLFNGQSATVSDTSQSPFVISVIPVVGDFAAAQQPVIVVLNEGVFMTVQATVSNDRRFVRLTVVPFFSTIGDVNTFQFEGSTTTREQSSSDGPESSTTQRESDRSVTRSGTTVQLPTFSFVTVTTTVSVPDGGTVLLGGIKRLREGRNEFGVPMLNKIPYVNRLFSNVGIGRETQSLMMMVTPRIIIQEEEEQLLGTPPSAP
jgi:general secretion pathway protein D